jgi:RNA polymerase subunit RPABC4/transcription elongation factor Spt4
MKNTGDFMNCKNCGARLNDTAKVCPNCGAFCDDETGYVILNSNTVHSANYDDVSSKKKKSHKGFVSFIVVLLVLAIAGGGSYYYFTNIYNKPDQPTLQFSTGAGIINGDETVVYAMIDDSSLMQYIQGVKIYKGNTVSSQCVSSDYEYTKNIDDSFRTVFFYADDLDLDTNTECTYTFEMSFSFVDDENVYTYFQTVTFNSNITDDASNMVFDHSMDKSTTTQSTQSTSKAQISSSDNSYIYSGYWFTQPYSEGEERSINALKFNKDGTFTSTLYYKKGNDSWTVSTVKGTCAIENGYLVVSDSSDPEKSYYKLDAEQKTLSQELDGETVQTLTNRKYNSVKNVDDFFGL